jgi:aryl-alcohol dehydrogenase-like predicted oxidoreductase
MPLPTRKIGTTDVTAIGYGAMGIAAFYGKVEEDEERLKVRERVYPRCKDKSLIYIIVSQFLDHLHEQGCTFWDTANVYMDSEDLLGKWSVYSFRRHNTTFPAHHHFTLQVQAFRKAK